MDRFTTFTLLLSLTLFSGCASLKTPAKWFGDREEEIEYGRPAKIVAIWTNSVFNEPGNPPVRGLGGRVYFYDAEHQPVAVDGKLAVFLYDDTAPTNEMKQEATKVVHFTAEQVANNFSPSEFGPSYSFWVPWDAVGGVRTQLSVIPVFTGNEGLMLVGEQARHLLPGTVPDGMDQKTGVAQVGNFIEIGTNGMIAQTSASVEEEVEKKEANISRFKLPPTMQQRLRMPPPKREILNSLSPSERSKELKRIELLREAAASRQQAIESSIQRSDNESLDDREDAAVADDVSKLVPDASTKDPQRSVRSRLEPHQARTSPSSQRAYGLDRSRRGLARSLFDRS